MKTDVFPQNFPTVVRNILLKTTNKRTEEFVQRPNFYLEISVEFDGQASPILYTFIRKEEFVQELCKPK